MPDMNDVQGELMDMIIADKSPSQISDRIKDMLFAKSAERVDSYRPEVAKNSFNSAETETLNVTGSYIGLDAVSYNPEIKVVDIATNNVTDAVIDLTVYGLPNVIQVKNDKGIFTDFVLVENQIR